MSYIMSYIIAETAVKSPYSDLVTVTEEATLSQLLALEQKRITLQEESVQLQKLQVAKLDRMTTAIQTLAGEIRALKTSTSRDTATSSDTCQPLLTDTAAGENRTSEKLFK